MELLTPFDTPDIAIVTFSGIDGNTSPNAEEKGKNTLKREHEMQKSGTGRNMDIQVNN